LFLNFNNSKGYLNSRMAAPIDHDIKRRIIESLSEHVYIPVYRNLDLSTPAFIGEPWSPSPSGVGNKMSLDFHPAQSPDVESSPKAPMSPFGRSPSLGSPLLVATSGHQTSSPRESALSQFFFTLGSFLTKIDLCQYIFRIRN
jgi:hypothetical protein